MKKVFYLMAICLPMILLSCSKDDDNNQSVQRIPVTESEIQGEWASSSYGAFHHFTFKNGDFTYILMDEKGKDITDWVNGTYKISGTKITFTITNVHTTDLPNFYYKGAVIEDEIYWETSAKIYLHIYPKGSFMKM